MAFDDSCCESLFGLSPTCSGQSPTRSYRMQGMATEGVATSLDQWIPLILIGGGRYTSSLAAT